MVAAVPAVAAADERWDAAFAHAIQDRRTGNIQASIGALTELRANAGSAEDRTRAEGELGASLVQARRGREAREALAAAHEGSAGATRARYAVELGNVAFREGRTEEARKDYGEAIDTFGAKSPDGIAAALNLARAEPASRRLEALRALKADVDSVAAPGVRARLLLNLGDQASLLGEYGSTLAHASLEAAVAIRTAEIRVEIEALDALAQLHESEGRRADADATTRRALAKAGDAQMDLRVPLEWRRARIYAARGEAELSLAAFDRAVDALESIRADIPIEYDDGRSSYRATFEPLYFGLADQLLRKAGRLDKAAAQPYLRRARDVVELTKQAEMQDYLGDRCEVEAIHRGADLGVAEGTAVLYPIILEDRVELLLETQTGFERRTTAVHGSIVRATARLFAATMRGAANDYLADAQRLYSWLLAPFEDALKANSVRVLVIVPDSALRLVPFAALHDGRQFVVEKFATAEVTGLSMVNPDPPARGAVRSLVAGVASPGPVVEKLPRSLVESIAGTDSPRSAQQVRERLALPGVKEEVSVLGKLLDTSPLLDEQFTVDSFERQVQSGDYRIVHVASHGVFGSSADQSYILAYDDVLTMDRLQALLRSERLRRNPIEILSLSACETAEGDDRSPLGISGAAMKARAKAVVGTLWPVEDEAARIAMEAFYRALTSERIDKAQAMRAAQLRILHMKQFAHPFFWAPFILIGNWQ